MLGTPVDDTFDIMDLQQKQQTFAQMAKMLKALQDYQLPESITDFGGVTFNDTGRIVSTAMTSVGAGPWSSYEASFKSRLEVALKRQTQIPTFKDGVPTASESVWTLLLSVAFQPSSNP